MTTHPLVHAAGAALVILAGILALGAHDQDKADKAAGVVTSDRAVMAVVFTASAAFAAIAYFWGLPA